MAALAAKKHGGKTHVAAQKRPAAKTGKQPTGASIALTPMKRPAAHRDTATGTKKAKPAPEHSGPANKSRCPRGRVLRGDRVEVDCAWEVVMINYFILSMFFLKPSRNYHK